MKNAAGIWNFNKEFGSCQPKSDDQDGEGSDGNPGCKNLDVMIPVDSGLGIGCKVNAKGQFVCNLDCPEGTNFMGKEGELR